ncbi:FecR family protein [Dinghuibacter silviterrae]|uniref:FecR family protein n=2 Tax=Dinghuibacter silviterrae TaxID=1539049 RepID=A0A4R8DIC3_9BACT|nr:FecR family protein [Dinghuibacter silviterrae]
MNEEEWDNFQPNQVLSPDISDKLWNNIDRNTATPFNFRWIAVAASVVMVVGLSWYFIAKRTSTAAFATKKNNTAQKMMLALSDGSSVELLPNSTISYPENFDSLKREVILNGEATFTVAKDAAKPFSVYSNSVLITVLGTRFTVNASKVVLHEGEVKVNAGKNEYHLTPGDIYIFTSARIFHLEKDKDDGYVFTDYPLEVVFDQLQMIYNARIIYNKEALGNRTFIGKIDKKDSLSHILKSIALLNNFSLQKQGDTFVMNN